MTVVYELPPSRFGKVYSHDVIGGEANAALERIEAEQRNSALSAVRSMAGEDIESRGLLGMADMGYVLSRAVNIHDGLSHFVRDLTLEEVTAEYLGHVTKKIVEDENGEVSPEDCAEYYNGLAEFLPELAKPDLAKSA